MFIFKSERIRKYIEAHDDFTQQDIVNALSDFNVKTSDVRTQIMKSTDIGIIYSITINGSNNNKYIKTKPGINKIIPVNKVAMAYDKFCF